MKLRKSKESIPFNLSYLGTKMARESISEKLFEKAIQAFRNSALIAIELSRINNETSGQG